MKYLWLFSLIVLVGCTSPYHSSYQDEKWLWKEVQMVDADPNYVVSTPNVSRANTFILWAAVAGYHVKVSHEANTYFMVVLK